MADNFTTFNVTGVKSSDLGKSIQLISQADYGDGATDTAAINKNVSTAVEDADKNAATITSVVIEQSGTIR